MTDAVRRKPVFADGRAAGCDFRVASGDFFRIDTVFQIQQIGVAVKVVEILQKRQMQGVDHIAVGFLSGQSAGEIHR